MDHSPTPQPQPQSLMSKYLLFAAIIGVAIVSVLLAVLLPRQSADDRNKAFVSAACAGEVAVAPSVCNEGCGSNDDCGSGMICYKVGTAVDGVCRNPQAPTSTTCVIASATPTSTPTACNQKCGEGLPPCAAGMTCTVVGADRLCRNTACSGSSTCVCPTGTPVASTTPTPSGTPTACVKTCTFNYDCNLAAGESCVGTNSNNSPSITAVAPRAATTAELALLAPDQVIYMGPGNTYKPDSTGKVKFSVISKKATTFFINVFDIVATKDALDPQNLVITKSFAIGANQVVTGEVVVPRCGRYQVDYGSLIVAGTPYETNSSANYFWGTVFETPCKSGCCVAPSAGSGGGSAIPAPAQNASSLGVANVRLVDTSTQKVLRALSSTASNTISKTAVPKMTVAADIFPANTAGSLKFELNGSQIQLENYAPFSVRGDVSGVMSPWTLNPGTYTLKVTAYSQPNAGGQVGSSTTVTLVVTQ